MSRRCSVIGTGVMLRSCSDEMKGHAKIRFLHEMPSAAKTAKKRSSPRAYTHDPEEVGGQGLAQICDFSLFPRPPPDIEI